MGDTSAKRAEAEKLMKKAQKYWQPSLMDFRLKPDWEAACPLLEKAGLAFRVRMMPDPSSAAPGAPSSSPGVGRCASATLSGSACCQRRGGVPRHSAGGCVQLLEGAPSLTPHPGCWVRRAANWQPGQIHRGV
jgi:hypothetical protein